MQIPVLNRFGVFSHMAVIEEEEPATLTPIYTTEDEFTVMVERIAAEEEPEYTAWTYFVTNYVTPYVSSTPTPASPGDVETYTALDTDSRRCRNMAIAWRLSSNSTYGSQVVNYLAAWSNPVTGGTPYVGNEQNAYHQAYGLYSFAFAYQVAYSLFSSAQRAQIEAWFQTWANAMKSMMDTWATNWYFSNTQRMNYSWEVEGGGYLTLDGQDWYEGRDATFAPMCAWLAAAIVCGDTGDITNITTQHRLMIPTILHSACAGDNDGDGIVGHPDPVPTMTIRSTIDYMTYNARVLTMAYTLMENLDLATQSQKDELYATWVYLSRFFGTSPESPPRPGDTINHSVADARFQMPLKIWGGAEFLDDVENSTVDPTQFYESQFLGPMTLVAPAPSQFAITSLSATHASIGSTLYVYGVGFGSSQGTSEVYFGELPQYTFSDGYKIRPCTREAASYVSWSDTQIVVTVPSMSPGLAGAESTYHPVYVEVAGEDSNRSNFYIDPVTVIDANTAPATVAAMFPNSVRTVENNTYYNTTDEEHPSKHASYTTTMKLDATNGTYTHGGNYIASNTYNVLIRDVSFVCTSDDIMPNDGGVVTLCEVGASGGYWPATNQYNLTFYNCVFHNNMEVAPDTQGMNGVKGYHVDQDNTRGRFGDWTFADCSFGTPNSPTGCFRRMSFELMDHTVDDRQNYVTNVHMTGCDFEPPGVMPFSFACDHYGPDRGISIDNCIMKGSGPGNVGWGRSMIEFAGYGIVVRDTEMWMSPGAVFSFEGGESMKGKQSYRLVKNVNYDHTHHYHSVPSQGASTYPLNCDESDYMVWDNCDFNVGDADDYIGEMAYAALFDTCDHIDMSTSYVHGTRTHYKTTIASIYDYWVCWDCPNPQSTYSDNDFDWPTWGTRP